MIKNLYVLTAISDDESDNVEDENSEEEIKRSREILDPNSGSIIWGQIQSVEDTPALKMNWSKTKANEQWMKTLKIDPNNIVS